jgi:hypothetical protein
MRITIDEVVSKINKRLNFPAFAFEDMDVYFDQSVSEINTLMHIGIKPITKLVTDYANSQLNIPNVVLLTSEPTSPVALPTTSAGDTNLYYFDITTSKYMLKVAGATVYTAFDELYGVYIDYTTQKSKYFQAWKVNGLPFWFPDRNHNPLEFNLGLYLPIDWVTLFLVPYVCAALSTRDGGNATAFQDEFIQGFNQLKSNYDVPSFARLNEVAGDEVYAEDVEASINDPRFAQIIVPTRAIKGFMRVPDGLEATYFYTKGW